MPDVDVEDGPVLLLLRLLGWMASWVLWCTGRSCCCCCCWPASTSRSSSLFASVFFRLENRSIMRLVCSRKVLLLLVDTVVAVVFVVVLEFGRLSPALVVRRMLLRILALIDLIRTGVVLVVVWGDGGMVAGTSSSAMHHAVVERDVSWVSCIACRR